MDKQVVEMAIRELQAQGERVSVRKVLAKVGGRTQEVARFIKDILGFQAPEADDFEAELAEATRDLQRLTDALRQADTAVSEAEQAFAEVERAAVQAAIEGIDGPDLQAARAKVQRAVDRQHVLSLALPHVKARYAEAQEALDRERQAEVWGTSLEAIGPLVEAGERFFATQEVAVRAWRSCGQFGPAPYFNGHTEVWRQHFRPFSEQLVKTPVEQMPERHGG